MNNLVHHLFGNKLLEDIAYLPLILCHRQGFIVKIGILYGYADRRRNRLQQLLVAGVEVAVYLIKHLDNPCNLALRYHGHTQDSLRMKIGNLIHIGIKKGRFIDIIHYHRITGNSLAYLYPEILQGLYVNIQRNSELKPILTHEKQRPGLHIHNRTDHVHGVPENLVYIKSGRCKGASDLFQRVQFPIPFDDIIAKPVPLYRERKGIRHPLYKFLLFIKEIGSIS